MTRQIISKKDFTQIKAANIKIQIKQDNYLERLFKYIPSEIILLYITCEKIILSQSQIPVNLYWFIAIFCLIATPLYLFFVSRVRKISQIVISSLSFAIWVFALGGPFSFLTWYKPLYGAIALPIFTFVTTFIK
ncbi:MAG: hypothetical protein ACK4YF_07085 [Exilispira sp.]